METLAEQSVLDVFKGEPKVEKVGIGYTSRCISLVDQLAHVPASA